ncbi:MAG: hypothetical protein AAGA30_13290, partial [Planctomycetota bacterium]
MDKKSDDKLRKSRPVTSDAGLLGDLVQSRFFQLLIGNGKKPKSDSIKHLPKTKRKQQSILGMAVDVILFALLVLIAPIATLIRFGIKTIAAYWWIKFTLGILAGLGTVLLIV